MTNNLKRIARSRIAIIIFVTVVIAALCIIPATIKANNDRAKRLQVESVGIILLKSELNVYYASHTRFPDTLGELLKDGEITASGGTATAMRVLPYFKSLRYADTTDHTAYTIIYTSYDGSNKSVDGKGSDASI